MDLLFIIGIQMKIIALMGLYIINNNRRYQKIKKGN